MFKRIIASVCACLMLTQATQAQTNQPKAQPIERHENKHNDRQLQCLARNIYFEAGNQSEKGMIAVANVVYNRIYDRRWPDTPCEVIYQRRGRQCQFSWVCQGRQRILYAGQYQRALIVARRALNGELSDVTGGAKFYHAVYVNPGWPYKRSTRVGDHIFYRG